MNDTLQAETITFETLDRLTCGRMREIEDAVFAAIDSVVAQYDLEPTLAECVKSSIHGYPIQRVQAVLAAKTDAAVIAAIAP